MTETTITSADGTMLAARSSGRGSPVVLVHGANGDLDSFALIEGPLAEHQTVWVYSRRGRGGSGDGPDYTLQREIDDLLAVVAATGDRAHVVGHSGGAIYALFAATQAPSVRSLVLYEPPLHRDRFDMTAVDAVEAALDAGDPGRALELMFPAVGVIDQEVEFLRSLPPVWERVCEGVQRVPRELRVMQDDATDWMQRDPPDIPTLYLYGEETDAPVFATPGEVAELWPKAQLHGLPGQRHLAFAFDPTAFAQAVLAFTTTQGGVE